MSRLFIQFLISCAFVVFFAGCQVEDSAELSDEKLAVVAAEVEQALWAFHAADTSLNAQGVIDLLWPEYTMLADGNRIGYADVEAGSRAFMESLVLFHTEWSDVQIRPLSSNFAISSFIFRDSILTKEGKLTQAKGPNTFVWQKRAGEWRVLYGDADHYPIEPGQ